MLQFKKGVDESNISREVWFAIGVAFTLLQGEKKNCVVTSLRDGKHLPTSLHYRGQAVDLRTRHLSPTQKSSFHISLYESLNPIGYDVILEKDHIHIEYDPKVNEDWEIDSQ